LIVPERLGAMGVVGIGALVAGIWSVGLAGRKHIHLDGVTMVFALGTSAFTAAYTIVDGLGGRISGSPTGYAAVLFVLDGLLLSTIALVTKGSAVVKAVAPHWRSGFLGAGLSAGAYWIAIWAMSHAPIASVAALRETSILVVMMLSMRVLKETVTLPRLAGAGLILVGAMCIRLS